MSPGTVFLLTLTEISSRICSASAPSIPWGEWCMANKRYQCDQFSQVQNFSLLNITETDGWVWFSFLNAFGHTHHQIKKGFPKCPGGIHWYNITVLHIPLLFTDL